MADRISILCATDNAYAAWCGIMLTSVLENNQNVDVYILTEGLNSENSEKLKSLSNIYNCTINIVVVDSKVFNDCPIRPGDHVSLATYYRLAAPLILPKELDRIIYLDCDLIVDGCLSPLWETDIDGYALGAVIDETYFEDEPYHRLGLVDRNYFSAGVLLINLKYWREHNVMQRCFECIANNSDKLLFHDQDTLNIVLEKETIFLPLCFNVQTGFLFTLAPFDESMKIKINHTLERPIIIHFTGYNKPWIKGSQTPFVPYFLYYKSKSIWKNYPLLHSRRQSVQQRAQYFIYELIWRLGIKKRPKHYIIKTQYK